MTEALLVSNLVLWVLVIVLALVVLALARQVGILHERVAPAGALQPTEGPKVGELTEPMSLEDLQGNRVTIGGVNGDGLVTFVLFISPTCPVCKSLVPTAKSLARKESARMRLLFASDGDNHEQHVAYAKDLQLDDYPYVLSQPLGMAYHVSKLPFALLIGADGSLQSKGLVNTREHLESLIEAMDSGIATLQDYVSLAADNNSNLKTPVKEQSL
ncbi:MAG: methylamine dehydrogenase accessory protein MauD [Woeseiaceae bacterium]|jgi:methylamine dehydrogenase accessory protein MauD